jgi:CheY-like chemotaxis protein
VKFTTQGGRVTALVRRLTDGEIEVAVEDTGGGIPTDFLPFVIEPFRQADANLGRGHGGLGLGLAITRQLVELHGGAIRAISGGIGQGATFLVRLPRHGEPRSEAPRSTFPAREAPSPNDDGVSLEGVDILLVDDEQDALVMIREALEAAGAQVRAVTTAADAIHEHSERVPDLLVTDLELPGIDGLELLQLIRSKSPDLAAVAVTSYARLDDRSRALAAGFKAHVSKPIDPTAFVKALASAVSQPG